MPETVSPFWRRRSPVPKTMAVCPSKNPPTKHGVVTGTFDTGGNLIVPDQVPQSRTDPLSADTDLGRIPDGEEYQNRDGFWDPWETDPSSYDGDAFAAYLRNVFPCQQVNVEAWNATPFESIIPAYSLAGGGPSSTSIGVILDLTRLIGLMEPFLSDGIGRKSIDLQRIPASPPLHIPIWFQAIEVPVGSILPPRVSNPVLITIGLN